MTVAELKEILDQFDDNEIIYMAKDGEGNSFASVNEVVRDYGYYSPEDREVYVTDDAADGTVLVIWPGWLG